MEAGVSIGLEALATQAAELGKTAAQQERFYTAVRNVAGTGLMVFGASKLKGAVKGRRGLRKAPTTVAKDAGKKAASAPCSHAEAELKVGDAASDALNQAPYHPRAMEAHLQAEHGAPNVHRRTP